MEHTELINLLIKLVALGLSILLVTIVPKIKEWLNSKLNTEQLKQIIDYTVIFVKAAEQLMKDSDPTGENRKAYVVQQLEAIGVTVTDQVNAIIESEVLKLNK